MLISLLLGSFALRLAPVGGRRLARELLFPLHRVTAHPAMILTQALAAIIHAAPVTGVVLPALRIPLTMKFAGGVVPV